MMSLSRGLREPCSSSILQARGGASRRLDDARSELIGTLLRDGKIVSRPRLRNNDGHAGHDAGGRAARAPFSSRRFRCFPHVCELGC